MRLKDYLQLYTLLQEAPHIEFANQYIDLEAETHHIIPRLIHILLGHKIKDKYNSEFQIKSEKDIIKFFKEIIKDKTIQRFLNKEIEGK